MSVTSANQKINQYMIMGLNIYWTGTKICTTTHQSNIKIRLI